MNEMRDKKKFNEINRLMSYEDLLRCRSIEMSLFKEEIIILAILKEVDFKSLELLIAFVSQLTSIWIKWGE